MPTIAECRETATATAETMIAAHRDPGTFAEHVADLGWLDTIDVVRCHARICAAVAPDAALGASVRSKLACQIQRMGTPAEEGVLLSQLLATAKAGDEVWLERALAEFVVEQSDDGFMARWYVLASGALEVVDSLPGPSSGASALLAALARSMRCEDDLGEIVPIARLVHDFPHPDLRGRKSLPSRKQLPMMASALLTLAQDDELTVMVRLDPVTGLPVAMLDATTVDLRELDEATKLSVLAMKYVNAAGMNDSDALTDIAAQISQFRDGELHVMTNIVSWLHEAMKNRSEAAARWRVPPHL